MSPHPFSMRADASAAGGTEELGDDNPDVLVTWADWDQFEQGLVRIGAALGAGTVAPLRLHLWAESRYGYEAVSRAWMECLSDPRGFLELP